MYVNLCPSAISLKFDNFEEMCQLALQGGFEGIDFHPEMFGTPEDAQKAGELIRSKGLKWGLFFMPKDMLMVSDADFEIAMTELEQILPKVKAAGCTRSYNHIFSGNNDREYEANKAWHKIRIERIVGLCSKFDVVYGLEYLGPKTLQALFKYPFICTIGEHLEFLNSLNVDKKYIGIVLDTYHWHTSGGTIDDLNKIPDNFNIANVHLNDAPSGVERLNLVDGNRQLPGETGVIDLEGFMNFLKNRSYDGPVMCEPFNPHCKRYAQSDKSEVLKEVSFWLKKAIKG